MNKTWKPITAGIIEIVSGIFQLLVFAFLFVFIITGFNRSLDELGWWLGEFGYFLVISVAALMGLIAMIGGIYTLERKKFGLSLMGAVAACFAVVPALYFRANDYKILVLDWPGISLLVVSLAGIVAIMLVLLSKKAYE